MFHQMITKSTRIDLSSLYKKEGWWAVWIGLTIFALSLPSYLGLFTLGWIPAAKPWTDISHALTTKMLNPWIGLVASILGITISTSNKNQWNKNKRLVKGILRYIFCSLGDLDTFKLSPLVKIIGSAEVGYIIALVVGIVVPNIIQIRTNMDLYSTNFPARQFYFIINKPTGRK